MIERVKVFGENKIAVVAGSESNLKTIMESEMFDIFKYAGISFELHIISADRNPDQIDEFCHAVIDKGKVEVIITIAGLAAVLASAIKARVGIIPVLAASMDAASLSANINKPKGVAIGVCGSDGVNACYNSAILAAEIVANGDQFIAENLEQYLGMKRLEKSAEYDIDPELLKKKYLKGSGNR